MSDHSAEAYAVAWALYLAEMTEYEADRDLIDTEWALVSIRECWLRRAQIALDAQALHRLSPTTPTA